MSFRSASTRRRTRSVSSTRASLCSTVTSRAKRPRRSSVLRAVRGRRPAHRRFHGGADQGRPADGWRGRNPAGRIQQPFVYRGFRMVDEEKLRNLRGDELRKLNQNGILPLVYAHLFSLSRDADCVRPAKCSRARRRFRRRSRRRRTPNDYSAAVAKVRPRSAWPSSIASVSMNAATRSKPGPGSRSAWSR